MVLTNDEIDTALLVQAPGARARVCCRRETLSVLMICLVIATLPCRPTVTAGAARLQESSQNFSSNSPILFRGTMSLLLVQGHCADWWSMNG